MSHNQEGGRKTNLSAIPVLLLVMAITVPALAQLNATEWFDVGLTLFNQDRYNDSMQAYYKVTEIDPQNSVAWNNIGIDLGMLGRYEEALKAFDRATMINSSYAEAWYNRGAVHDLQGDYNSAIQDYTRAIEINPSYQKALINKNNDIDIITDAWPDWNQF
jgi:tetratricopeptide (TPR) repeat protein